MGPGVTGQLVDFLKRKPEDAASCENCHAPLSEQHEWLTDANGHGRANARFAPELRAAAVSCAACHVRGFHRNGPPRNPQHPSGIAWTGLPAKPHGEVFRTPHFEQSQFCAPCHQFGPGNDVNGKPLENTLEEWRRSVYARQGVSCQVCHMPERRHLWRGIHDPAMVRRGVSIAFQGPVQSGSALTATLTVSNTRVGHDFPTYITPQVLVRMEQQDQLGRSIPGTRREWRIGRTIDFTSAGVEELSDTRIPPGESRSFSYRGRIQSTATRLRAWIQVYPDHYYTGFYHQVLAQRDRSSNSKRQLLEALTHSQRTSYLLFDRRVELGR
jgi:hypothetical protein